MSIKDDVRQMKKAAPYLAASSENVRNNALKFIANALKDNRDSIFEANRLDTDKAEADGISQAVMKRLKFTPLHEQKLKTTPQGAHGTQLFQKNNNCFLSLLCSTCSYLSLHKTA